MIDEFNVMFMHRKIQADILLKRSKNDNIFTLYLLF
jgi:hypothetical protein